MGIRKSRPEIQIGFRVGTFALLVIPVKELNLSGDITAISEFRGVIPTLRILKFISFNGDYGRSRIPLCISMCQKEMEASSDID